MARIYGFCTPHYDNITSYGCHCIQITFLKFQGLKYAGISHVWGDTDAKYCAAQQARPKSLDTLPTVQMSYRRPSIPSGAKSAVRKDEKFDIGFASTVGRTALHIDLDQIETHFMV
jgi:hypothetical protein